MACHFPDGTKAASTLRGGTAPSEFNFKCSVSLYHGSGRMAEGLGVKVGAASRCQRRGKLAPTKPRVKCRDEINCRELRDYSVDLAPIGINGLIEVNPQNPRKEG